MTAKMRMQKDCEALAAKQLLTREQLADWNQRLATDDASRRQQLREELRVLFKRELDELITRLRLQQNQQQQQTLQQSDLVAVAAGGVLGMFNAWMRPAPAATPTPAPATRAVNNAQANLWASAFDGAQAFLNVSRQRRVLDHVQITHMAGDETTSDHVLLCVNGFMTQGADPSKNWGVWAQSSNVVLYALQWEAGDVDVWNEFCAHANENLKTSSAHELLTHFTGNPWHKAEDKASQVGVLLAQVLASEPTFCRGRRVSLLGHSLGGAVIYSALKELSRMRDEGLVKDLSVRYVKNALVFGGAFIPSARGLGCMAREIASDGKLINVYSERDDVLSKLYWALQLHAGGPIAAGCAPVDFAKARITNGVNIDVSDLLPPRVDNQFGHSYGHQMEAIRARVQPYVPLDTKE
ncbi:hypothetical protein Poli38472_010648 [Pythium oligandrum]|uniref:Uncharacterized protein n=1 Tax=Pythium oligandrum TaxID=41045 RepID=A0A8K1C3H3_PYTOL|nr:hypothetical protein Poli38472_010648 [Pythium oligandrum]|eukprot:TMW55766.1 hypothetical protein Poli38472_010648 [Pythium oligandrum]